MTELKIDKSFVMTMTVNDQDAVIVRTLVELGRSLGLRTVAEGVESADAKDLLRSYGCDEAQGYLFSRPVPGGAVHRVARSPGRAAHRPRHRGAAVPPRARRAVGDGDTRGCTAHTSGQG